MRIYLVAVGLVGGSLLGCGSQPYVSTLEYPRHPVTALTEDLQRLKEIEDKAPEGAEITIQLPNLFLPIDCFSEGIDPKITSRETDAVLAKNKSYLALAARLAYLDSTSPVSRGQSTYSVIPGEPRRIQACEAFAFRAVPVKSAMGQKYYVKRVVRVGSLHVWRLAEPVTYEELKMRTRSDFVNPEDIDWILQVKDFTKVTLGATSR